MKREDGFLKNKKVSKTKYHLYILSLSRENFSIAMDERFSRITPTHILIYTKKRYKDFSEITNENVYEEMSKADREWLFGCNLSICSETITRNPNTLITATHKFFKELEQGLELVLQEESDGRKDD